MDGDGERLHTSIGTYLHEVQGLLARKKERKEGRSERSGWGERRGLLILR